MATAGVASADVALSGAAEMGIVGGSGTETQFHQDIDVTFSLSGTADNGLTFGAAVDLDEAQDDCDPTATADCVNDAFDDASEDGGVAVFISGDFGTLTMGDTDGALDWALTEADIGNAGSIADDETGHGGFLGAYGDGAYDGQILRYDNTFGDFGFAVSVEVDEDGVRDPGFALGAKYSFAITGGTVDVGIGYQFANHVADASGDVTIYSVDWSLPNTVAAGSYDTTILGISAAVVLDNGLSAAIQYSDWETSGFSFPVDTTHIGIGAGYTFDAITLHANWGQFETDGYTIDGGTTQTGYGLAASYDFGGGLSAHLGYGNTETFDPTDADEDSWSFGLAMSF